MKSYKEVFRRFTLQITYDPTLWWSGFCVGSS